MPVPTPGGDINVWGAGLNAFLSSFVDTATGQLLDSAVGRATLNIQTGTAYTLVAADAGKIVRMTNGAANTITIPSDANMSGGSLPVGTVITVAQGGAGSTAFVAGSGVTLQSRGALTHMAGQFAWAMLVKIQANVWELSGDIA